MSKKVGSTKRGGSKRVICHRKKGGVGGECGVQHKKEKTKKRRRGKERKKGQVTPIKKPERRAGGTPCWMEKKKGLRAPW